MTTLAEYETLVVLIDGEWASPYSASVRRFGRPGGAWAVNNQRKVMERLAWRGLLKGRVGGDFCITEAGRMVWYDGPSRGQGP